MIVKTKSFELAINTSGNENSEKLALVLPGKLDSKDYSHMIAHIDFLSKLGFNAVSFDPPGTWESPGDISLYNTTNYLKAVDELIEYFGNKATFVMGHSRGASVAMISAARNPKIKSYAAIMPSITADGFRSAEKWEKGETRISFREIPPGNDPSKKREFVTPYSLYEDQLKYKADEKILSCDKPKLIVVGKKDNITSPDQIRNLFNTLSQPKELLEIDYDHNYRKNKAMINKVNHAIKSFLQKYQVI